MYLGIPKGLLGYEYLILALLFGAFTAFVGASPRQLTVSGTVTGRITGDPYLSRPSVCLYGVDLFPGIRAFPFKSEPHIIIQLIMYGHERFGFQRIVRQLDRHSRMDALKFSYSAVLLVITN